MKKYRINYRDIKERGNPKVEYINSRNEQNAYEQFLLNRKKENWNHDEIFNKSLFIITCEDTKERFRLDNLGQLIKSK